MHYLNRNPEGSERCLIMTASLAGYLDLPGTPQYSSAKWGVRGLMRALRTTHPTMGMRVNIISPWFVKTPIMSAEVVKLLAERGVEYATKEDAAAAVLHIASDKSINGKIRSPTRASLKVDDVHRTLVYDFTAEHRARRLHGSPARRFYRRRTLH